MKFFQPNKHLELKNQLLQEATNSLEQNYFKNFIDTRTYEVDYIKQNSKVIMNPADMCKVLLSQRKDELAYYVQDLLDTKYLTSEQQKGFNANINKLQERLDRLDTLITKLCNEDIQLKTENLAYIKNLENYNAKLADNGKALAIEIYK
jgi:hypothetical protein